MDLKRYDKTRYENIYRHKKNKNYLITISNPKTCISMINGKKIFDIEQAKKLRDDPKIRLQKKSEIKCKNNFDELWDKYIYDCKYIKKLSYNTILKKKRIYDKYLKEKITKPISKLTKTTLVKFIDEIDTTDKQKNEILNQLHGFFTWCMDNEILIINPLYRVKKYKVTKNKMKYWSTEEVKKFFDFISSKSDEKSYRIRIMVLLGFSLGDRIGETRAIVFKDVDTTNNKIYLKHSIDYDPDNPIFVKVPKNDSSIREVDISPLVSKQITDYRNYLLKKGYTITEDTLIFLNHNTKRPYSDTNLRKQFYQICDEAGVKRIRMYDLRHTYVATMMAEGKELYLISERLGHSSYSTTVNKYGHLSNEVRKEVALATDKYL